MTLLIPAAVLGALFSATHWGFAPHAALLPLAAATLALAISRRAMHITVAIALLAAALGVLRPTLGAQPQSALARLVSEREVTALRGEVVDEPAPRDRAQLVRLRVSAARVAEGDWRVVDGTAQLVTRLVPTLHHGDFVEARGRAQPPEAGNAPGYAAYLRRQGIDAVALFPFVGQRGERIATSAITLDRLYDTIVRLRSASVAALERLLPEPHAALAQGMLLGRRATMPPELTDQLRLTGLSHLTAVSGYNVSLVIGVAAAAVGLTSARRGWRRPLGVALASALLWCFVALVGASGSVLRAAAMAQLALVGIALGRRGTAGGMLLWGSALLALWSPAVVADVGWQLSFLGTAGLSWCAGPIERRLARLPGVLRGSLAATLAAQLFVFPVLASVFGSFSVVAPVSNVFALPLVPWIMLASFLASACDLLAPPAAPLFASLAWVPLSALLWIVERCAALPWASLELPPLGAAGVIVSLVFLAALCVREEMRAHLISPDEEREAGVAHAGSVLGGPPYAAPATLRQRVTVALGVSVAALVLVGAAMAQPITHLSNTPGALVLELPVLDDGTLLFAQSPDGARLLVDGGPTSGGATALLGRSLKPWDRTVDAIVLADPRESHLLGAARVLERYRVGLVADAVQTYPSSAYRRTRDAAQRSGAQQVLLDSDVPFSLGAHAGALTLTPLATTPRSDGATFPAPIYLQWGPFSALLPGDATPAQLRSLLAGDHDLRATVIVIPERLLRYHETARLLAAADPELVITQGKTTAQPPPDADLPTAWYRTSLDGPARLIVYPNGTYALRR